MFIFIPQALLPVLLATLASVSELRRLQSLAASSPLSDISSPTMIPSRIPPHRAAPYASMILSVSSDYRPLVDPVDPRIQLGSETLIPQSRSYLPLHSFTASGPSSGQLPILVLLVALLWPCAAGLPYAALTTVALGAWAMMSRSDRSVRASTITSGRRSSSAGLYDSIWTSRSTLIVLFTYCCSHLMLQYIYMVVWL